ncbi:sugar phosphate isomerase/epimerase family protein [Mediterraneibacter agrestimuris]|uniref:sugar phosphate isomerase/epimerase family protein n=1 Tax=Mediterraneibacter agrestimuris TaxID=2941333 RepID=UPI002040C896|nr:sugar phosphate isomerase/epimerase family protein [Mediterraneibacter agrestimuris]
MKIGVRAHDYGKMEIEQLAETLHDVGYEAAQLALPKAFTGIESYADITPGHLERIRAAFEKHSIEIPVFGCYMDLGNPDEDVRRYAVDTMKRCLAYSKEVGAKVLGTETAYPHLTKEEKKQWYPYMVDSIKRVVDEAVRLDVKLAVEPVFWHPLESVEAVLDVMGQVKDEAHLRMIFDASNLLEYPDTTDQREYWTEWLSAAGKYIEAMHIKDFYFDQDRKYCPTPLGKGAIDYRAISEWLHVNRPDMYLLREEMNPETAQADITFLRNL